MSKGDTWERKTYEETSRVTVKVGKSVTHEAEVRSQSGLGLDPSVDPKTHGATRESVDVLLKQADKSYLLTHGIALAYKTDGDLTGSMGDNINQFFKMLPRTQRLLVGRGAILERYDVHFCTGGIQDERDRHPYMISEFERDNLIEAQMAKIVPERDGYDPIEDYQLGLFYAGERIKASILRYGLKGYYNIVGDMYGRDYLEPRLAKRVFGLDVQRIPTGDLAKKVLEKWHAFFLQVGTLSDTSEWWADLFGKERVVKLPTIEMLADVQACITGLTEGILDLQNLEDYLVNVAKVPSKSAARAITDAVSGIPIRAQADLPNFNKIPLAGTQVSDPEELYPDSAAKTGGKASSGKTEEINLNL